MSLRRIWTVTATLALSMCVPLLAAVEVYFSPNDRPTARLIELIQGAKKRIHAAVYMLTDQKIADQLIAAKQRNVDVQIIVDKISMESSYGKGKKLQEAGISMFVYNPKPVGQAKHDSKFYISSIMHNKFALFDDTQLWTGSFNWTRSANQLNHENVIITDDAFVRTRFDAEFKRLKAVCSAATIPPTEEKRSPWSLEQFTKSLIELFRLPAPQP